MNWKLTFSRVKAALRRRGRTVHEAEDLVQEAWVRMASHGANDTVVNPAAFLMRTALNLSIDAHRAKGVHGTAVAIDDVVLVDVAPGAEALLLGKERLERMTVGLGRLPDRTREIFLAHRLDGRSYTEIARELGISINAVEKHVTKATLLLTSWMEGW
ncbi:MAG: RNA polymerase sigma factor [Rubrivivax sp.]|nr:RNA polymerase sigma factor [Rubrivivax sp.]